MKVNNTLHPDSIELIIIADVYKKEDRVDKDGEEYEDYTLVKKDAKSKETIWKSEISAIKEVINTNGNIRTKRSQLNIKNREPIVVEGNYKLLQNMIFNKNEYRNTIGFKIK